MLSTKPYCRSLAKPITCILLITTILISPPETQAEFKVAKESEVFGILAQMDAAYAQVESYQTEMEVREYRKGKYLESKRFLYTFRKPNQLRIDMRAPRPGTVLCYPDRQGKVTLRSGGWTGFVALHLAPDNALLASGSGQRIDQSDFGLLLRNIRHSLSDHRRGEIAFSEAKGRISIEVPADDHFLPGVQTLYRFVIDATSFLPLEVHECTVQGSPKRISIFGNLRTSSAGGDVFGAGKGK